MIFGDVGSDEVYISSCDCRYHSIQHIFHSSLPKNLLSEDRQDASRCCELGSEKRARGDRTGKK